MLNVLPLTHPPTLPPSGRDLTRGRWSKSSSVPVTDYRVNSGPVDVDLNREFLLYEFGESKGTRFVKSTGF